MHEFDIPAFPHETESFEYSYPKVLSESQELELAAELMEVNSEQELEQFLGDLIKKAGTPSAASSKGRWARLWVALSRRGQTSIAHGGSGCGRHVRTRTGSRRAGVRSRNEFRPACGRCGEERSGSASQCESACDGTGRCQSGSASTRPWPDGTGDRNRLVLVRSVWTPPVPMAVDTPDAGFAAAEKSFCWECKRTMPIPPYARWMLEQEARALLTRLARVKPFALQESMLPAANLLPGSQLAIEKVLMAGRKHLRKLVWGFLHWLHSQAAQLERCRAGTTKVHNFRAAFQCRGYSFRYVRQRHYATQRERHRPWLSGLDVVSAAALQLKEDYYKAPPVICYLDRGVGAAIRRARTRMPGGGDNPVAIVRPKRNKWADSLPLQFGLLNAALWLLFRGKNYSFGAALKISTKRSAIILSSPSFSCQTAKPKMFGSLEWPGCSA
jgi:hypothetical protein